MSKIALMTLLDREDSSLSPHFGKAKWILVREAESGPSHFVQNHGMNGKSVVEQLLREGCTDVICSEIGMGAVEHLHQAHVRGWLAPAGIPAPRLVEMLLAGSLQPVSATKQHGEGGCCRHGGHGDGEAHAGGGCGCSHPSGSDRSGGCCQGE
ncbi:MAG: NifB/NifX family molybdenum-iron cluster-binding protein [Acidobacteriaceae bacterium]